MTEQNNRNKPEAAPRGTRKAVATETAKSKEKPKAEAAKALLSTPLGIVVVTH